MQFMASDLSSAPSLGPEDHGRPPLVLVVGPTGVGKTEVAIRLARRLNGEIVSADSRLFYRGMDIGTAKPSAAEQAAVRHHLVDIADPDQVWSLAQFQERARLAVAEIHAAGKLPFLVGGTGQFMRAVAHGWQPPAAAPNPRLRAAVENWMDAVGEVGLHNRLAILDPDAAAGIDPRNHRRTVRALEVIFTTGRRFSDQRKHGAPPYRLLTVGLTRPREDLYARIDARIDAMFAAGWVAEVRDLLAQGYSLELPAMSAIGYREIAAYLGGEMTLDESVRLIKRRTRIYVRRQANWFKPADPQISWFNLNLTDESRIADFIESRLNSR